MVNNRSVSRIRLWPVIGLVAFWLSALTFGQTTTPPPTQGIAELEAHKRRIQELEQTMDPVTAARLRQMHRLLSLMQKSIETEATKATPVESPKTPADEHPSPAVVPEESEVTIPINATPTTPQPSEPVVILKPQPSSLSKQAPLAPKLEPIIPAPKPTPPALPPWILSTILTTSLGYQDNVLRSAFSDLDSATLHGELDLQTLNTKRRQHRATAFARYTRTRFLEQSNVRDEDLLFLLGQYEYGLGDAWWLGITGSYLMAHQPFDDPDFVDIDSGSAPLKFTQLSLVPQLTWEPDKQQAWTGRAGFRRETTDGLEDFESQDNEQWFASLDYRFTEDRHQLRASYSFQDRRYDERAARVPDGTPTGHSLDIQGHDLSLSHRYTWQWAEARCRLVTKLGYQIERGDGGGYDDSQRIDLRTRFEVRQSKFDLRAELRYGRYFYDDRQVSFNDDSLRQRDYWVGRLEASYALQRRVKMFVSYEHRDNSGNRTTDDYQYRILYTGFRFKF